MVTMVPPRSADVDGSERMFVYCGPPMRLDLRTPESVEQMRRSLAMLAPQAWALRREEATEILAVLCVALRQLDEIEAAVTRHPSGHARKPYRPPGI